MDAGIVMEVLSFKPTETRNGEAIALTVILPEHANTRGETTLIVPNRFADECERKVPCLLFYEGCKKLEGGKRCHEVKLIKLDDGAVFHDSDDECFDEDDEASDEDAGDDEPMLSINDFLPNPCPSCKKSGENCFGYCGRCKAHQPPDGSQCRCFI